MSRILRRIDVRRILVVLGLLFVGLIAGTNSYGLLETEIDSVLPDTLLPGDESIELVIEGEEFISDCFIEFEPPLVIVDEIEFISDGELRVVVSVPLSAPPTPLTVIYVDEAGPSLEFPDLLEIIGLPIITGFDPLELEGPAPEQEITLFGDYFNEDWAETLSATATLNNLDGPQLVASLLTWMNEYTLLVTVDTPEELYLPPCSLELEVVDPLSAGSFSCSLPIDVEEPPLVEPSISAIEASVSSSVELGTYPLELQVEISLTGENLPVGGNASDLAAAIQSHEIEHLMLQDKGTLALDVDSETSASGYVELELLNDDRSFAEDAEGSLELLLLSESFAADYDLELNWPGPVLDPSLVLECADTLTGSQIGDAMLLDENPINVEAVLTGDYFPTDLELDSLEVEVSGGPLEVAGYDLQRQSAGQAVIDIELMPLGAEVELSASIGLTVEVGIGTDVLTGALDLPVELEMLVAELLAGDVLSTSGQLRVRTFPSEELLGGTLQVEVALSGENLYPGVALDAVKLGDTADLLELDESFGPDPLALMVDNENSASWQGRLNTLSDGDVEVLVPLLVDQSAWTDPTVSTLEAVITLEFELGDSSIDVPVSIPLQKENEAVFVSVLAAIDPPPLIVPEASSAILSVIVEGEGLGMMEPAEDVFTVAFEDDIEFEITEAQLLAADDNELEYGLQLEVIPPAVGEALFVGPLLDGFTVTYQGHIGYHQYLEALDTTLEADGDFSLVLSYPPEVTAFEVDIPAELVEHLVSGPELGIEPEVLWTAEGVNLGVPYFENAQAQVLIEGVPLDVILSIDDADVSGESVNGTLAPLDWNTYYRMVDDAAFEALDTELEVELVLQPSWYGAEPLTSLFQIELLYPEVPALNIQLTRPAALQFEAGECALLLELTMEGEGLDLIGEGCELDAELPPAFTEGSTSWDSVELDPELELEVGRKDWVDVQGGMSFSADFLLSYEGELLAEFPNHPLTVEAPVSLEELALGESELLGDQILISVILEGGNLDFATHTAELLVGEGEAEVPVTLSVTSATHSEMMAELAFNLADLQEVATELEAGATQMPLVITWLGAERFGRAVHEVVVETELALEAIIGTGAVPPPGLHLLIPEDQAPRFLFTMVDDGDGYLLELELELAYLVGDQPVTNVRGLRLDEAGAIDAFILRLGLEEHNPTAVDMRGPEEVLLTFELTGEAAGPLMNAAGEVIPAELLVVADDLTESFEPVLLTEQDELGFELQLATPDEGQSEQLWIEVEVGGTITTTTGEETEIQPRSIELGPVELTDQNDDGAIDKADAESALGRIRYFKGQTLTAGDFEDEQSYHPEKLRTLTRTHGYGIVRGLELSVDGTDPQDVSSLAATLIPVVTDGEIILGLEIGLLEVKDISDTQVVSSSEVDGAAADGVTFRLAPEVVLDTAELYTILTRVTPDPPDGLVYGSLFYIGFAWTSLLSRPPIYGPDGLLVGFEDEPDYGQPVELVNPEAIAALLTKAGVARFKLSVDGVTYDEQAVIFESDGYAHVEFDIGDVKEGAELEVEEQPVGPRTLTVPDEPEFPDTEPVVVVVSDTSPPAIPRTKAKAMPEKECYAAREEAERAKEEYEREKEKTDCSEEYERYRRAAEAHFRRTMERKRAGESWTLHQERHLHYLQQQMEQAWADYQACMNQVHKVRGKMWEAERKAKNCQAPPKKKEKETGKEEDSSDEQKQHYVLPVAAGISTPRSYGATSTSLDYEVPASYTGGRQFDHLGQFDFTFVTAPEFPGGADGEPPLPLDGGFDPGSDPFDNHVPHDASVDVDLDDAEIVEIFFVPLYPSKPLAPGALDVRPNLGVGISTLADESWPAEWLLAGDPVAVPVPQASDEVGASLPLADVEFVLELTDLTPSAPDGMVYGDNLYLRYRSQLYANVPAWSTDGITYETNRLVEFDELQPVLSMQPAGAGADGEIWLAELPWDVLAFQIEEPGVIAYLMGAPLNLVRGGEGIVLAPLTGLTPGAQFTVTPIVTVDSLTLTLQLDGGEGEAAGAQAAFSITGVAPVVYSYGATAPETDCQAAYDEVRRLRENPCDCHAEWAAYEQTALAYADAEQAAQQAEADAKAAEDAIEESKKEAEQAEEEAKQTEQEMQNARQALADYINDNVPGCSALVGDASEAGSFGYGAQHAGGYACGGDFVGVRIGNEGSWNEHRAEVREHWEAWKDAYYRNKEAQAKARAARAHADGAPERARQARQAAQEAAAKAAEAKQQMEQVKALWEACQQRCADYQRQLSEAEARAAQCPAREPGQAGEGTPEGTPSTPGAAPDGETAPGGDSAPGDGEELPGGDDGGGAWEPGHVPPVGGQDGGDGEDTGGDAELRRLLNELEKLRKAIEDARRDLEDNPLVEEVRLYENLTKLLDNLEGLDTDVADALKQFVQCNSQPLKDLLKGGEDKIKAVVQGLRFLEAMITVYTFLDRDMSSSLRSRLQSIASRLSDAADALEKLLEDKEKIDELIDTIDKIKEGIAWPDDIAEYLLNGLVDYIGEAAKEMAKKAAEEALKKVLTKLLGSAAGAAALLSMAQDLINFIDALSKLSTLEERKAAWNKKMLELIRHARGTSMGISGTTYRDYVFGLKQYGGCKITLNPVMHCFCPEEDGEEGEGEWKAVPLAMEPHDSGSSTQYSWTKAKDGEDRHNFSVTIPPKNERPCKTSDCYLVMNITVECPDKDGKMRIVVEDSIFMGVLK